VKSKQGRKISCTCEKAESTLKLSKHHQLKYIKMINIKKPLILIFTLISLFACQQEEMSLENNKELKGANEITQLTDDLDSKIKILPEEAAYMNSLPDYNPEELAIAVKKESQQSSDNRSVGEVWGIGTGRTVWKWNGNYWTQPNPAARLDIVEVAKNGDESVWGIGRGGSVWKWNGASWGQPNPAARLLKIAVYSSDIAFGIAWDRTLFITTNGGQNWATFTSFQNANWASSGGDYFNILSVSDTYGNLYKYDLFSQQLDPVSVPQAYVYSHATMFGGGIWVSGWVSKRVYRSIDFLNFTEPNTNTFVHQISSNINERAWAIGNNRTVWKTTNSGASWYQPNSAARLDYISAAW